MARRTFTYIVAAGVMALSSAMFTGCFNFSGFAGTEEVEDLKQELAESRRANEALQDQYIEQNKELTRIVNELAAVTGKTASLRMDVENGSARLTQAEQISGSIDKIKARIAALEKSNAALSGSNKEFQKMIDGFKKVIEEQESQIVTLKKEIEGKDVTIRAQKDTIMVQTSTILSQKQELQKKVEEQAKLLCEAGILLEEIADNAPEVSWKKNKEKIGNMVQDIYSKALLYYRKSYEAGYAPAKDHIEKVNAKIAAE